MIVDFLVKHGIEWFGIMATISLAVYIKVLEKRMNKEHKERESQIREELNDCHQEHLESKERYISIYEKVVDTLAERDLMLIKKLDEMKDAVMAVVNMNNMFKNKIDN